MHEKGTFNGDPELFGQRSGTKSHTEHTIGMGPLLAPARAKLP